MSSLPAITSAWFSTCGPLPPIDGKGLPTLDMSRVNLDVDKTKVSEDCTSLRQLLTRLGLDTLDGCKRIVSDISSIDPSLYNL